jgi:hypothetical protein
MARPQVRRHRLPTPPRRGLAPRKQLLQPPRNCAPTPRCQTTPVRRNRYSRRPLLAQQTVVPRPPTTRFPRPAFPVSTGPILPRLARQARGGRTTRLEHRGLSSHTPSWLYTRRGAIGQSLRAANATSYAHPRIEQQPHPNRQRYRLIADATQAPWSFSMATRFRGLLGRDHLGTTAISLLRSSLAPSTYSNYDSALRPNCAFCDAVGRPPLHATRATMVRYTTRHGLRGTVVVSSMPPCFSAINKYFRDHHLPPIAVSDLLADARRGLERRQPHIVPSDTRLPLSATPR